MLSLTNTWLLHTEGKKEEYLILGGVCVINIGGEKEAGLAPWRRKDRGKEREEGRKEKERRGDADTNV